MNSLYGHPLIFFDGVCNLCNGFVRFVISRDRNAKFRFAPLQSEAAKKNLLRFGFPADEMKTIVLVQEGKVFIRSKAVLKIVSQLGGIWKLTSLLYIIPPFLSDGVYNLISKFRYKLFGKKNSCMVPSPESRGRFIE